jgi:hypothetical protein
MVSPVGGNYGDYMIGNQWSLLQANVDIANAGIANANHIYNQTRIATNSNWQSTLPPSPIQTSVSRAVDTIQIKGAIRNFPIITQKIPGEIGSQIDVRA